MPPTITDLIPVPVHGHTLFVADDPVPLVPLRPICEALGLSWSRQRKVVVGHPTFAPTVAFKATVAPDGRVHDMLFMPSDMVMLWLGGVHPDKVAAKVRDTLIAFQRTAARLIYSAWAAARAGLPMGRASAQGDLFATAPVTSWLSHPDVQAAILLRREADTLKADAAGRARELRRESASRVRHLGLRAVHLDMLTAATTLPPEPKPAALPLFEGA